MESSKTYPYQDKHGHVLYSKIRVENNGSKSFYWEREENGVKIKNIEGCTKVLYNLPQTLYAISNNIPVFLVEGEKDVHTLRAHPLAATTTPGSLEWNEEFTQTLQNADVVVLYDNDKTGRQRRDLICKNLYGRVKRLRVVDLPGLEYRDKHGQDITDWIGMGHTITELEILVDQTPNYTLPGALKVITLEEFLTLDLPERKMLLDPFLTEQGLVMLYAKRGVGKTHIALGISYAVASGGSFLKWHAPEPRKVLYIDGEMPATSMQQRLLKISCTATQKPPDNYLRFITPDQQENPIPDLATKEGRAAIEPFIQDVSLVVVDNISALFRSGAENEAESWQPVQDWALELRRKGKSVLFVHHAGKSGQQRGTSKREDILDVVINLKQSDDYHAGQGAFFEVHFEKTRHFAGEQANTFQVQLAEQSDGSWVWLMFDADHDPLVVEVANMRQEGKTYVEITQKTKLTKSQIETKIKKAKETGLMT